MAHPCRFPFVTLSAPALAWVLLGGATITALAAEKESEEPVTLSLAQQRAVGIRVEHPSRLSDAPQIEAYGVVLDPVALAADVGRVETTQAAASAAAADAARSQSLYRDGARTSLKALQAAQTLAVEADSEARTAALAFRLNWGPLAAWNAARRHALLETLSGGREALLRAEVPGRHTISSVGSVALVEIDGLNITAQVLGACGQSASASRGAGWLLELQRAPQGLVPGARASVRLQSAPIAGLLVPEDALIYSDEGTYVYRQVSRGGADTLQYAAVPVTPLVRVGAGWLVEGLGAADQIVVQGTGVLWSLQGISSFSAAEEEHD